MDWLRSTGLLSGFKEHVNSFMVTLRPYTLTPEEIVVYTQDPMPNASVHVTLLDSMIEDVVKRTQFIEGKKDEFFAD